MISLTTFGAGIIRFEEDGAGTCAGDGGENAGARSGGGKGGNRNRIPVVTMDSTVIHCPAGERRSQNPVRELVRPQVELRR